MDAQVASKRSTVHSTLKDLLSDEHTLMVVFGILVGVAGGYGAVGFRYLINFIQSIAYGSPDELLEVVRSIPWYMRIAIPAVGGLIVGFGTKLGSGCTSGHGVCGIGRLSPRSIVATLTFMATGIVTVFVIRHLIGG